MIMRGTPTCHPKVGCFVIASNPSDPATCVFISTSRDHPLHLFDAYTGKVSLSKYFLIFVSLGLLMLPTTMPTNRQLLILYVLALLETSTSLRFIHELTSRIYAGYNKRVCVWDVSRPGREYKSFKTVPVKSNRPQKRRVDPELALNGS
jgi:hypothetical protein